MIHSGSSSPPHGVASIHFEKPEALHNHAFVTNRCSLSNCHEGSILGAPCGPAELPRWEASMRERSWEDTSMKAYLPRLKRLEEGAGSVTAIMILPRRHERCGGLGSPEAVGREHPFVPVALADRRPLIASSSALTSPANSEWMRHQLLALNEKVGLGESIPRLDRYSLSSRPSRRIGFTTANHCQTNSANPRCATQEREMLPHEH